MKWLPTFCCFIALLAGNASPQQSDLHKFAHIDLAQNPLQIGKKTIMEKILKIEDSAMEEWRRGNPMKWIEISADDVVYIDPGLSAPIVGKAAYIQYLEPLKGQIFYDKSEYVNPNVAMYGKTAVMTYNYHSLKNNSDGQLQRTSFWNTTEVYRLIGDEWRIVHTHWSYIQHNLPESLEVQIPVLLKKDKPYAGTAAEILRLETDAMERWRKGDPYGFLEISAPEVTYFDTDTPARLNGYGELKDEYDKLTGRIHYDVMEFIHPRLRVFDDTAVLFYQFFSTTINPNGTVQSRIPWNCTEVYAKTAGGWKIVHTHWSFIKSWRKDGGV